MKCRTSFLTVALAGFVFACSGGGDGNGAGGAGGVANPGMGNNNPPVAAGSLLGGDQASPNDTDQAPRDTDRAPSDTEQAPDDTDQAPSDTDQAPGSGGGGAPIAGNDCGSICTAITQACAGIPQDIKDECIEECHDAMEGGCFVQFGIAAACYAGAFCAFGGDENAIEATCRAQLDAADCNGGGDGDGDGDDDGSSGNPGGGSGCAGLQACCNSLDGEEATQCQGFYDSSNIGGDQACGVILSTYQAASLCP